VYQWKAEPFASVSRIRSLGNELCSQFLDERKHIFSDSVDKQYFRKINDYSQFRVPARNELAKLFSSLSGESALEPADQSTV
jgi:hypothetical protein